MKKSVKIVVLCACLVACSLIAMSFAFLYVGTDEVTETPQVVRVQTIDGETCLVTDYSAKWTYQFQIEQKMDGTFYAVQTVSSDVNTISLMDCQFNFVAGCEYRFSACYANGNITGDWSNMTVWTATWALSTPENVTENDGILSWDAVSDADGYSVSCVNGEGTETIFEVSTNSFDLSRLSTGNYKIYVKATSTNEYLTDSENTTPFEWTI